MVDTDDGPLFGDPTPTNESSSISTKTITKGILGPKLGAPCRLMMDLRILKKMKEKQLMTEGSGLFFSIYIISIHELVVSHN